jgi:hypothetical protein
MSEPSTSTQSAFYKIYLTESLGGGSRNHIAIFVATAPSPSPSASSLPQNLPPDLPPNLPSGIIFNTTGTILLGSGGQTYEVRPSINPQYTPEHIPGTYRCIGRILKKDFGKFEKICEGVEVPGPQVDLRGRVLVPGKKVRRCGEWVGDVVEKARREGVLLGEEEGEEDGK